MRGKTCPHRGNRPGKAVAIGSLEAEKVLARLHDIGPGGETAFAARIGNLKRQGAVKSARRGKRLAYELDDIWALDFCLALEQFQIDPASIARIMRTWWRMPDGRGICDTYRKAAQKEDLYVAFRADFLANPRSDDGEEQPIRWFQCWTKDELASGISSGNLHRWLGDFAGLIPVSNRVRKLNKALSLINAKKGRGS
jgi:hypothetical protein